MVLLLNLMGQEHAMEMPIHQVKPSCPPALRAFQRSDTKHEFRPFSGFLAGNVQIVNIRKKGLFIA